MKTSSKILLAVGIILTAFLIYYQSRFQHFKIASEAMYSSLLIDDILLFDKHFETVKTKDIVAFNTSFVDAPVCSRVVGLPNDKVKIKDGVLLVNSMPLVIKNVQYEYSILSNVILNEKQLMKQKVLLEPFTLKDDYGNYITFLNEQNLQKIKEIKGVKEVIMLLHPKSYEYRKSKISIFPNHKNYYWSRDNFGEVVVPKMGVKFKLNDENLPLYIELIKKETGGSVIEIEQLKNYTFKENYYFMMSDNRHNAIDSRYFGFVAESEIIGVYSSTIYSPN